MGMSMYIEWLFTYMAFHLDCSAYNINSEVCLEKPFEFALSGKACSFTLTEAKDWFESETDICSKKCQVKIKNLESGVLNFQGKHYTFLYQLTSLVLSFDNLDENLTTIQGRCNSYMHDEKRTMEIICKTVFENNNLKLNETCQRNEQCSVVFGSVCQNNTCGCGQGYVPFNDSECISLDILKKLCTSTKDCEDVSKRCSLTGKFGVCVCKPGFIGLGNKCLKEDNIVNVIFGLGGLILGAIATVLAVTINHHIRKGKSKTVEKERPGVATVNNATLETEMDAVQSIPTVHCTNEGKNGKLLPFAHSVKLLRKRNAQEAKKRSMTKKEENGDIYNHLHEKENDPDIDEENYYHVPGNLYHAMGESNYSNL